jgi:hypothetical protein
MSAPPDATAPPGLPDTSLANQLDGMVQQAFSISFELANLHGSVSEDAASRIERTIDLADDLVRRTRHVALELALQAQATPPDPPQDPIEQATRTLSNADQTLTTLWNQAQSSNGNGRAIRGRLTDASRLLRRAAAALDESNLR